MMQISANIQITAIEKGSVVRLVIESFGNESSPFPYLCFSIATPLVEGSFVGCQLVERQGDWHKLRMDAPADGKQNTTLEFKLVGAVKKATDYPAGLYLENTTDRLVVTLATPVERNTVADTKLELQVPVFIPHCDCDINLGSLFFPKTISFDSCSWSKAWLHRLFVRLNVNCAELEGAGSWTVKGVLTPEQNESFELNIESDGALLSFKDQDGFHQGQAFLFQYMLQWSLVEALPPCKLKGSAGYSYRGVHLDVARHFFSAEQIVEWLDIFALYQFNTFHWHLTDDDGWRIESKAYPELTKVGAWRGPDLTLPPQMGTGKEQYGGFYNQQQIVEVVARAQQVGITIVPEMDLPGHARALLKSLPDLVETNDESAYRSVQFHNDNVINPAYGATMEVIETLVDEWCGLFPGRVFHVGSDEIPKGVWQKSPSAQAWAVANQKHVSELQGYFLSRIESRLNANGKTMAGWEEVVDGGGTSTATWVYSWQGTKAGVSAAKAGHSVVMTPAQYCYFDLAMNEQYQSPGYWWAGTVDVMKAYQYKPKAGFSEQEAANIRGVLYCLWSELIETPQQAEFMWFPRLLAGAEVVFESNTIEGYSEFLERLRVHSLLLSKLGISVNSEI